MRKRVLEQRTAREAVAARTRRHRRGGSVLVLVMAILGVLFVTGVTFLSTLNFESRMIKLEEARNQDELGIESVGDVFAGVLVESLFDAPGRIGGTGPLSEPDPNGAPIYRIGSTWAELPEVHGVISSLEPYEDANSSYLFRSVTNYELMRTGEFSAASIGEVDTAAVDGVGNGAAVDADGDGIADSLQLDIKGSLPPAQLARLSAAVNDPAASNPGTKVYLGLRVIPHGAMVNLNDSHPEMIRKVLGVLPDEPQPAIDETNGSDDRHGPYSPAIEEAALRRRFMLPPRIVPISAVQGNTWDSTDDPPGGGDFGSKLFAPPNLVFPSGESVRTDEHQYWPYSRDNDFDQLEEWQQYAVSEADGAYDRRHLCTTISHDDLLMRGAAIERANGEPDDVLEMMAKMAADPPPGEPCDPPPFAYLDYPDEIAGGYTVNGEPYTWCECEADGDCEHDPREGRLRLSLPWLDGLVPANPDDRTDPVYLAKVARRSDLIQEAFVMLLLNARSGADTWGAFEDRTDGTGRKFWAPDWDNIALTAASLTANMIDFQDGDDEPTKVEIRSFDRTNPGPDGLGRGIGEFVYGLEEQPYITEIAALVVDDIGAPGQPDYAQSAFGLDLFNPYERTIEGGAFSICVNCDDVGQDWPANEIPIDRAIAPRSFLVIFTDGPDPQGGTLTLDGSSLEIPADPVPLSFTNGDTIFLLRKAPEDPDNKRIVVDQFEVTGTVANVLALPNSLQSLARGRVVRVEDNLTGESPWWFAPIPADRSRETSGFAQLGVDKGATRIEQNLRQVEVLISNKRSFETAFPTTGSLLLLMRHANRPIDATPPLLNQTLGTRMYAFTTHLRRRVDTGQGIKETAYEIDNGRMPVFDVGNLHHFDPDFQKNGTSPWEENRPGELMHLPWGQLVFDYFTALPLKNAGPYRDRRDPDNQVDLAARPRVDQEGLRVHGRVNLNAAPWRVLAGLPYVPMSKFPEAFSGIFEPAMGEPAQINTADNDLYILGEARAKAIVAYRDAREIVLPASGDTTGNYGDDPNGGRAWVIGDPANPPPGPPVWRRGTGFVTVGELANVRHLDATDGTYRMDDDALDNGTFLHAIAPLAALGDWVTVRSDVFTVYGTLRGEGDPDDALDDRAKAIDDKALRFQETIDRLPVFMGESAPVRIGRRVISRYRDAVND